MKRFILSLGSLAVLFGAMSSPLLAAGHGGGHSSGHSGSGHAVAHSTSHSAVHTGHTVAHSTGHAAIHTVAHSSAVIHGGAHVGAGNFHGLHHGFGGYLLRDYRGWGNSYWNARYRCQWYYCPEASCYYYWYAPWACYLSVSQIALYPPTVTVVNNNIVNASPGIGTPGMPNTPMPLPQ